MQRIMIIGQPGSGKSTLARALSRITGLPVIHIDRIHWQSGWVERSRAEKTRLCHEAEAGEAWIFEGGHSATWDNRIRRADLLIWLDLPPGLRMWRVLWRLVRHYGRSRPDLPEGCPERLGRESLAFWAWIWNTRHSARQGMARLAGSEAAEGKLVHLRSRREVAAWLQAQESARRSGRSHAEPR
ncbi:AAA family ATPase [Paracoccus sp. IB05]|uniref:AAA family ATPase n=1 Tax=Paracoccus sp. IB05 TaxID=2779367 RepID=UPI0018E82F15|nr:AAA family ATPase [Paracoccus sp. IB05]MBJ2149929.1 AAA family ATPase [Paracoccus sp. IB05]